MTKSEFKVQFPVDDNWRKGRRGQPGYYRLPQQSLSNLKSRIGDPTEIYPANDRLALRWQLEDGNAVIVAPPNTDNLIVDGELHFLPASASSWPLSEMLSLLDEIMDRPPLGRVTRSAPAASRSPGQ